MIFYKQFDLSLANLPKGIPFSPAFALNTLTFCNGADRRWCSAIISTFPPICAILYCISAFYPFFAQRAVFSLISESEVSLHAVFPLPRIGGLSGIELCQPIADGLTFCISVPFLLPFLKELKEQGDEE